MINDNVVGDKELYQCLSCLYKLQVTRCENKNASGDVGMKENCNDIPCKKDHQSLSL